MSYSINAYAKINLGLDVLNKRADGYHNLKMIMQTIDLHDTLTFTVSDGEGISLECDKSYLSCKEDNLVVRAAKLLMNRYNIHKHVDIFLNKNIPIAAGMAGGSTDAAATLIAINHLFNLGLDKKKLMEYGVTLGADIPFCILGGTALSEGIGDILTPLSAPVDAHILIVKPDIDVSTGFVYGNLKLDDNTPHPDINSIMEVLSTDMKKTGERLGNILETVTIPAYPIIDCIKECMNNNGAVTSLMSGSGPTVFGLFDDENTANQALAHCLTLDNNMFGTITGYHNN
ncbi:MAG: 4-(cytidine 5'-diphospho)-2-C-methyl-D-erythritol kinase [Lachnospiraceae bacterium]|nr:4-(cytidine 5'-diphospho)-2-C-methyl-D-erythritol kinase [Lachnospiraceae bacterium]